VPLSGRSGLVTARYGTGDRTRSNNDGFYLAELISENTKSSGKTTRRSWVRPLSRGRADSGDWKDIR
jgi:hypothetical protein